jgi:hypothetical protein
LFRRTRAFFFCARTDRETDRQTQTLADTDTATDTDTDTDTDTQIHRHRHRRTDTDTQTKRHTPRPSKLNPRDSRLEDVGLCPQRTKEARALTKP